MKDIIKKIAKMHGVEEREVLNEIQAAFKAAMQSTDQTALCFWQEIASDEEEPSVEKVIAALSLRVQNTVS